MLLNLIFLTQIMIVVMIALVYRKVLRIDKNVWNIDGRVENITNADFQQISALASIYLFLEIDNPLPATRKWAGSPDFLLEIAKAAKASGPANVLECSSGTSTVILAYVVKQSAQGHVYSLEHDPIFAEKTRQQLRERNLEKYATVIDAPLCEYYLNGTKYSWYDLKNLPDLVFNLLVVDGPPATKNPDARYPTIPILIDKLTPTAVMYLDDANRAGEQAMVTSWLFQYPQLKCEYLDAEKGLAKISLA